MSRKINDLIQVVKLYTQAADLDATDVTTAVMVLLYELAICKAAVSQSTAEQLSEFIHIIEESFGEYLKDHAKQIEQLNTLGAALRGRP